MKNLIIVGSILLVIIQSLLGQDRKELVEERTFNSKTFVNADNSYSAEFSAGYLHYIDESGKFQEIDRTIQTSSSEYDFEVTKGLYHVYFKSDPTADFPVVFETKGGGQLRMKLKALAYLDKVTKDYKIIQKIKNVTPRIEKNQIIYGGAFTNIDVKYIYMDKKLKEEVILTQRARDMLPAPASYGLTADNTLLVIVTEIDFNKAPSIWANNNRIDDMTYEGNERINFRDIRGNIKFFLPKDQAYMDPNSVDSLLNIRDLPIVPMKKRLIHPNEKHLVISGIPYNDLKNTFPQGSVILDPSVEVEYVYQAGSSSHDAEIDSWNPTANKGSYTVADLGPDDDPADEARFLIKFPIDIKNYWNIQSAEIELYFAWVDPNPADEIDMEVRKMLVDWNESTCNWYTGDTENTDYSSEVVDTFHVDSDVEDTWGSWDITSLVEYWQQNPQQSYGMIFMRSYADRWKGNLTIIRTSEYSQSSYRPKLTINYSFDYETTYYIRDAAGSVIATYRR